MPSPTLPLGNDSAGTLHMPDTLTAPPPTTPATTPPPMTVEPAKPSAPASDKPPAGECWRLQVAAPLEKAKAESRRAAAQSLLLVPMVIEFEKDLYKVRTHDCMTNAAAESLKKRAEDSGFDGSFVLNAAAATPAARPKPKPHAAPAKHSVAKKKKKHR